MKYKIFLDTNFFWQDNGALNIVFNSNLKELRDFLRIHTIEGCVEICIPEVVLHERMTQQFEHIKNVISAIDNSFEQLKIFKIRPTQNHKKQYRTLLKKKALEDIEKYKARLIKIPKIKHEDILRRAFERVKPFSTGDKGYKDTLLWLSLLQDAKDNHNESYIWCTKNVSDFDITVLNPEFKKFSNKPLHLVKDLQELKELLDKELSLSLDLKVQHAEITNEIKANFIGEIISAINSRFSKKNDKDSLPFNSMLTTYRDVISFNNEEEEKISGYSYRDMDIDSISGDTESFYIKATIQTNITYEFPRNEFGLLQVRSAYHFRYQPTTKSFNVLFIYVRKEKRITVNNISMGF